ncbi:hypothetical protein CONLIGDRAFT_687211 [Coniochaeta ligniaria NRRL 30616]|uniref:Uncharacterized protein n=1 Tax=Coniochaeta ligniaria NRRL 30616 TaxID=1408157 RepID=A0A1J7I5J3_9PEZI|nr:hypothetical protein CONLIGDRAFT_687211 [Coniochaeta ligniaria NRRL 30616]
MHQLQQMATSVNETIPVGSREMSCANAVRQLCANIVEHLDHAECLAAPDVVVNDRGPAVDRSRHMYIPALPRALPETDAPGVYFGHASRTPASELRQLRASLHDATTAVTRFSGATGAAPDLLRKRDPMQSSNVTIGAVVGVLLGVFIIGTIYFCIRYHRSIRFSDNKKRQHHRRPGGGSSRGSKASTSSSRSAPAPPPAPPAPPPAAAAAAG